MEFTLYIGSKKVTHAIRYTYIKYACTIPSRTKEDTIWTKHQINQETMVAQVISKNQYHHKIDSKDLSHYKKLIKPKHKGMR